MRKNPQQRDHVVKPSDPRWVGWLWISPWAVGLLLFLAFPLLASFYVSLTDYPLLEPPLFIGPENYRQLVRDPVFWRSVGNTFFYAALFIPLATVLSLLIAEALRPAWRGAVWCRAAVFVPSLVPVAASAMIWLWLYNGELGLINGVLDPLLAPFGRAGPNWLADQRWAMIALVLMSLWSIGPAVVIYLAALQGVPGELYEAAAIDGVPEARRFWHITLPMISPVILFNVVIAIINASQVFAVPYIMTGGGPDRATYFYSMYLYDTAFSYGQMGYASALAWIQLLLVLGVTVITLRLSRGLVYFRTG